MPYRPHSAPEDYVPASRQARRCARGERCPGAVPGDDGELQPAFSEYGPFCLRDYRHAARCLGEMPEKYVELRTQLGAKSQISEDKVSGSRTPPVPVRLDFDAIIRDMVLILCSWEEVIARVERLERPYTRLSRCRRDEVALPAAVDTLSAHFDRLLTLPAEPMMRVRSLRAAAELPEGTAGMVHPDAGYAEVLVDLDGADAGLEIVHLHYRARSALRMTNPPPERLDGIVCRQCDQIALIRAAPPRSAEGQEYWSECTQCGHLMTRSEYLAWVKLYAAWIEEQRTLPLLEVS